MAQLLESCGGKVLDRDNPIEALALVDISRTKLAQSVRYDDHNLWEIDATDIEFVKKLGEVRCPRDEKVSSLVAAALGRGIALQLTITALLGSHCCLACHVLIQFPTLVSLPG